MDDLNLIGTPEGLLETANYLKKEFEMKNLDKTRYCLGLQIEYFSNCIFVHKSTYNEKVLKHFYMDNVHPLNSPMVVRSLEVDKDPFRPKEENEKLLGPEIPYLSAIGALMYLANCTRPDIAFLVNLLARYSSAPTLRHCNGVKHLLRYLRGTSDIGLFIPKYQNQSYLVILMQDTFWIPIRLDYNQDMYLLVAILLSLGYLLSKPLWQPPPIIQIY